MLLFVPSANAPESCILREGTCHRGSGVSCDDRHVPSGRGLCRREMQTRVLQEGRTAAGVSAAQEGGEKGRQTVGELRGRAGRV